MAGIDDTPLPLMIDRALDQTIRAGMTYAAVPHPWLWEWAVWTTQNGTRLALHNNCVHKSEADFDLMPQIDGDVYLCLLPYGHAGDCGYAWLIPEVTAP